MRRGREAQRGANWSRVEIAIAADLDRRCPADEDAEDIDWLSREGARRLARRIEEFWGGRVRCVIAPGAVGHSQICCVRSNLGPTGLPP